MSEMKVETKAPETHAVDTMTSEPGHTLYRQQTDRFAQTMESGLVPALNRYGFAFFHSLSPEDRMLRLEEMKIPCKDEADFYNLGLAYASKQRYEKAISCWEQAIKMEPTLGDALFNIATAHERLGDLNGARSSYKRYAKEFASPEEAQRIEEHLAEIGK